MSLIIFLLFNSYGYATNTRIKFVIITENSQSRDSEMSPVSIIVLSLLRISFDNARSLILLLLVTSNICSLC